MSPIEAAVVLCWLLVVLLAAGLAGVLGQVRGLRFEVEQLRSGIGGDGSAVPAALIPQAGATRTLALLITEDCDICASVLPVFAAEARPASEGVDYVVVGWPLSHDVDAGAHARLVHDKASTQALDVGWAPALVTVDGNGHQESVDPAGSQAAIRSVVAHVRETAGAS